MLISPHFLVGTAIANHIPEFWPAALAAVTSHFVLDAIPHRDTIGKFSPSRANLTILVADLTITGIILWWLTGGQNWVYLLIIGFIATLPDAPSVIALFWPKFLALPVVHAIHYWHTKTIHYKDNQVTWFWGILSQLVVIILAIILFQL